MVKIILNIFLVIFHPFYHFWKRYFKGFSGVSIFNVNIILNLYKIINFLFTSFGTDVFYDFLIHVQTKFCVLKNCFFFM